jgi:hypothetical protein
MVDKVCVKTLRFLALHACNVCVLLVVVIVVSRTALCRVLYCSSVACLIRALSVLARVRQVVYNDCYVACVL